MAQEQPGCSYDICALRIDGGGFFSSPKIRRGVENREFAKLAPGDRLAALFAANDSAAYHYKRFVALHRLGTRLRRVGLLALLSPLIVSAARRDYVAMEDWHPVMLGALVVGTTGSLVVGQGVNHLVESVLWYNGTLAK